MKSLISCFFLLSIITANAQVKPLTFSSAVKADNLLTPKDLYKHGKLWYGEEFPCANKRLVLDDPNQGVIVAKCTFPYTSKVAANSAKTKGEVYYQVKLRFREGRYECETSEFRHAGSGISFDLLTLEASTNKEIAGASSQWKTQVWNDLKAQAKVQSNEIIKSLISSVSKPNP